MKTSKPQVTSRRVLGTRRLTGRGIADLDFHLGIGVVERHERRQDLAQVVLFRSQRRVIVNGEDGDGSVAAVVADAGLAGQRAVAVDTAVDRRGEVVAVGEEAGRRVVHGIVDERAAAESGLDKGWCDARRIRERCDDWSVDTAKGGMISCIPSHVPGGHMSNRKWFRRQ